MRGTLLIAGLVVLSAGLLSGCIERTITVTSVPSGALVYLNDEEVGRTPLTVPFTFYGVYGVRLEKEGYQPLWTRGDAKMPWWDTPGIDLFAEMIPHGKSEVKWHYTLEPLPPVHTDALIDRARQMRGLINAPATTQP